MVTLTLRDQQFEVRAGMTLLAALEKCGILPESVIATHLGELILDDEILHEGDEIKLIAVISGGGGTGGRELGPGDQYDSQSTNYGARP
jgi:sulfur carrier protein ThiS